MTVQQHEGRGKVDSRFKEMMLHDLTYIPPRTTQERIRRLPSSPEGSRYARAHNKIYDDKTPETTLIHGLLATASRLQGEAFLSIAETLLKLGRRHAKKLPIPRLIKA